MQKHKVSINSNSEVCPCTSCGNNTTFFVNKHLLFPGTYELWIECSCGYDPTAKNTGFREECSDSNLTKGAIRNAFRRWNQLIMQATPFQEFHLKHSRF